MSFAVDREAYPLVFLDTSTQRDTYGGAGDIVLLESYLLTPRGRASDTVLVFMHPIGGGGYLPMVTALAAAGHHVVYCNSRYRGTDVALVMEKVVQDLGECVRDLRARGYAKVVLAGWSGGGALSLFYQQQAQRAPADRLHSTPAGDGPDLGALELPAADGVLLLAAHISRHHTLTEWLDASVLDERDPSRRDRSLDLYDPQGPRPPYGEDFLATYRAAQVARNLRITRWVEGQLAALREAGRPEDELAFVTHGTMADPRWLDPAVDPSDRAPGTCYLGDPRVVNNGPVGLARFSTLRSWLSQWGHDTARGDGVACARELAVPTLVIGNTADDACTPSHTQRLYEAVGHPDRTRHEVQGATHYYVGKGQGPKLAEAVGVVTGWLGDRGFAAGL